ASRTSAVDSPADRAPHGRTNNRCDAHAASRQARKQGNQMAELTISPEEIRAALGKFVESYSPQSGDKTEVGTVVTAGDGIATVSGLPSTMANELLRFEDGTLGLAQNLDEREIGAVVLGEFSGIAEGQQVFRTGEVLSVPVGDGYLGRVVNPLGEPVDGLGEIATTGRREMELQAAGV